MYRAYATNVKCEEAHLKHLVHIYHGKATVTRQKRTHSTPHSFALDWLHSIQNRLFKIKVLHGLSEKKGKQLSFDPMSLKKSLPRSHSRLAPKMASDVSAGEITALATLLHLATVSHTANHSIRMILEGGWANAGLLYSLFFPLILTHIFISSTQLIIIHKSIHFVFLHSHFALFIRIHPLFAMSVQCA